MSDEHTPNFSGNTAEHWKALKKSEHCTAVFRIQSKDLGWSFFAKIVEGF